MRLFEGTPPGALSARAAAADVLSLANGSCGLAGVVVLLTYDDPGALTASCVLVFLAWALDAIDGAVARGVDRAPAEGAILDSLCDTVAFGVLPGVLLTVSWAASGRAPMVAGTILGMIFFWCAVLRLRRYTVRAATASGPRAPRKYFEGLPAPAAAMSVSAVILAGGIPPEPAAPWLGLLAAAVAAPLMLSSLPYVDLPRQLAAIPRARWLVLIGAALLFAAGGSTAVAAFFGIYLASGAWTARRPRGMVRPM